VLATTIMWKEIISIIELAFRVQMSAMDASRISVVLGAMELIGISRVIVVAWLDTLRTVLKPARVK
jgi:hypothetical protein